VTAAGSATAEPVPAFNSGSRVYRCIVDQIGHDPGTSQFR